MFGVLDLCAQAGGRQMFKVRQVPQLVIVRQNATRSDAPKDVFACAPFHFRGPNWATKYQV